MSNTGGRYEIHDRFAAGGIATVHLARHVSANGMTKIVAVKKLHAHYATDPAFRSALLEEARVVSSIHHPNVVEMLEVYVEGDDLLLAMEYVHGISLAKLVGEGGPADPTLACAVVAAALEGLHAAHEAKDRAGTPLELVHRDVSPQNVLVGLDGTTRVIDFGLVYALGRSAATRSGVVKGKPAYMSPEQMRGERVTRASDVFSMGVTLWGLLTGRKLFEADTVDAMIFKVIAAPIPRPSTVVPDLPRAIDDVVMKALERAPTDRYPTALAFAQALRAAAPRPAPGAIEAWVARAGEAYLADMDRRMAALKLQVPSGPELLPAHVREQLANAGDTGPNGTVRMPPPPPKSRTRRLPRVAGPQASPARRGRAPLVAGAGIALIALGGVAAALAKGCV